MIPPEILKVLLDELLENECVELKKKSNLGIFQLLDPEEKYVHIERCPDGSIFIWHKRFWLSSVEHQEKLRRTSHEARLAIGKRIEYEEKIKEGLSKFIPSDPKLAKLVHAITIKVMSGDSDALAQYLGINVADIPKMPYNLK